MSSKNMSFQCALVTGGGGGIGKALAKYFISEGKKVIIAGRTEATVRASAAEIGAAAWYVLDTGDIPSLAPFVARLLAEHPEVDCLVNNAGVQRPLQALEQDPDEFLAKADQEIDINVRGPMHLTLRLLKHFRARPGGAVVVNVSSILGFVPFSVINPVYNGTKAWLHCWSLALRSQLRAAGEGGARIRVVEIAPPSVTTDLHRERADPRDNTKEKNPNALSVEEFMEFVVRGLREDRDTIGAGMSEEVVEQWDATFGKRYRELTGEE